MHRSQAVTAARWGVPLVALAVAVPLVAQNPDVAAEAPATAPVHRLTPDDWREPICAGAMEWTYDVPSEAWIEFPIGWIAVDHATAVSNWDRMRFELWLGDRQLAVPQGLNWEMQPVQFECPDRVVTGTAFCPMVYLPPLTTERPYRIRLIFEGDVNDGWATYRGGTDLNVTLTLRPKPPVEPGS